MSGDDTKPAALCGWVKMFHPRGVLVTLPVPFAPPEEMFKSVDDYFNVGFLSREVGLEAGEMKEEVGWVSRSTTTGRTGLADVIAYYSTNESWTKPFLTDYLNTDADRAEFEAATGIKPASIPEYIGEGRLERGKNPKTDALIVKLPRPVALVMKPNPKYNEAEAVASKAANKVYKVPKKVFVRWDGKAQPVTAPEGNHNPVDGSITKGQVDQIDDLIRELERIGGRVDPAAVLKWLNAADWYELDQERFNRAAGHINGMIAARKAVAK